MTTEPTGGPDLTEGFDPAAIEGDRVLEGHVRGEAVLVTKRGDEIFAVGATCTHYGGPLAKGAIVGDAVHCPLHQASFSLRTGEVLGPPALDPIPCYRVERRGSKLCVLAKWTAPSNVVIVGGGAAGQAAAETLRREGHRGPITVLSAAASPPCDRPNLSKDYLAGTIPEEYIPLRPPSFFSDQRIDLILGARAVRVDVAARAVVLEDGRTHPFDALLIATGADPVRLRIPGADLPHVHVLRSYEDARAILARLATAKQAVVVGASFIGLEVAASLRTRGLEVHVVAPARRPFEATLGPAVGDFVRSLHEAHGVVFHLGRTTSTIETGRVVLDNGAALDADVVVMGVGVRPDLALAQTAGVALDRGIVVDGYLETTVPGIFAAGDCARWPDPRTGELLRIEHWVVAERLGRIAARNILGRRERCRIVPFFWTQQFDVTIHYVGHAQTWDEIAIDGDLARRDCRIEYRRAGRVLAVATVGRSVESILAEVSMAREMDGR